MSLGYSVLLLNCGSRLKTGPLVRRQVATESSRFFAVEGAAAQERPAGTVIARDTFSQADSVSQ